MPTILDLDESELQAPAWHERDIDKIGTCLRGVLIMLHRQRWDQVEHIINGDHKPRPQRGPAVIARRLETVCVTQRQSNQLRRGCLLASQTDSKTPAKGFEVLHEKLGVAPTAAQAHLIECAIQQVPDLFEIAG